MGTREMQSTLEAFSDANFEDRLKLNLFKKKKLDINKYDRHFYFTKKMYIYIYMYIFRSLTFEIIKIIKIN